MAYFIKYGLLVSLLCFSGHMSAAIYQVKDASGNLHFSDQSTLHAVSVHLDPPNVYRSHFKAGQQKTGSSALQPALHYKLVLVSPKMGQTFQHADRIQAVANLSPNLQDKQQMQWILDGVLLPESTKTQVELPPLPRGAHSLRVQIVDARAKIMAKSDVVTFYIHQPSRAHT